MTNSTPPPPETEIVPRRNVQCDGGDGALGHPRVYLRIGASGQVECPYCDKVFKLQDAQPTR